MEGHSGQKYNLLATCIPLDRIRVPIDRTSIQLDCTFLPFDRTSIQLDHTFLPFDRTSIPLDRTFLPLNRTSIILSLALLHWFITLCHFSFQLSGFADHFDNVMTKFIVNNRTDSLKTDINLFFTMTKWSNCPLSLADASPHEFQIHVFVRILTIKISQFARENFCSYR